MSKLRIAAQAALDAFDAPTIGSDDWWDDFGVNMLALRTALAEPQPDPTDPGHDVVVLREQVRHLERRVRQLHAQAQQPQPEQEPVHECADNDSPWLICKSCAADGKCKKTEQEPVAPHGYILVPEALAEPTEEMLQAFQKAFVQQLHRRRNKPSLESAERAGLRAMLKAGETAEAPQQRQPLTDEQIDAVTRDQWGEQLGVMKQAHRAYARAIESRIKGGE